MAGAFSSAFSSAFDVGTASVGCAFSNAFSPAFDVCPVVSDIVVVDSHDGKPRRDPEPQRQAERRSRERMLRDAVETAFSAAYGEQSDELPVDAPLPRKELRRVARQMMPDLDADGIATTLGELAGLLEQYQTTLIAQRLSALRARQNEEAILVLMMVS